MTLPDLFQLACCRVGIVRVRFSVLRLAQASWWCLLAFLLVGPLSVLPSMAEEEAEKCLSPCKKDDDDGEDDSKVFRFPSEAGHGLVAQLVRARP